MSTDLILAFGVLLVSATIGLVIAWFALTGGPSGPKRRMRQHSDDK